jgi:hypothetical protein
MSMFVTKRHHLRKYNLKNNKSWIQSTKLNLLCKSVVPRQHVSAPLVSHPQACIAETCCLGTTDLHNKLSCVDCILLLISFKLSYTQRDGTRQIKKVRFWQCNTFCN